MSVSQFIPIVFVALLYLPFDWMFFAYAARILGQTKPSIRKHLLTYSINYLMFLAVTQLGFYLVINWIIVAIFLILEIHLCYGALWLESYVCGLQGGLAGLSLNLICRSLTAAIMKLPLSSFDSRYHSSDLSENYKILPISIGFLASGLLFWYFYRNFKDWKFLQDRKNMGTLHFASSLFTALFLYLATNLLIYNIAANDSIIKLWQAKTGICALVGFLIGIWHMREMEQLKNYEEKGRAVRDELRVHMEVEKQLAELAYTDILTGCASRAHGLALLEEALHSKHVFYVCFVDLDHLKPVNDLGGHAAGDRYLSEVSYVLRGTLQDKQDLICRYGGDEFFLLYYNCALTAVSNRMDNAQLALSEKSNTSEYPYQMSISYGVIAGADYTSCEELLKDADAKMYACKQEHYSTES